jgi:hypothetical protein
MHNQLGLVVSFLMRCYWLVFSGWLLRYINSCSSKKLQQKFHNGERYQVELLVIWINWCQTWGTPLHDVLTEHLSIPCYWSTTINLDIMFLNVVVIYNNFQSLTYEKDNNHDNVEERNSNMIVATTTINHTGCITDWLQLQHQQQVSK